MILKIDHHSPNKENPLTDLNHLDFESSINKEILDADHFITKSQDKNCPHRELKHSLLASTPPTNEEEDESWLDEEVGGWLKGADTEHEFPKIMGEPLASLSETRDNFSISLRFDKPITSEIMPKGYDMLAAQGDKDSVSVFLPFLEAPLETTTIQGQNFGEIESYTIEPLDEPIEDFRFGKMGALFTIHFKNQSRQTSQLSLEIDPYDCQNLMIRSSTMRHHSTLVRGVFCPVCAPKEEAKAKEIKTLTQFDPDQNYLITGIKALGRKVTIETNLDQIEVRHEIPYTNVLMEGLSRWEGHYKIEYYSEENMMLTTHVEAHKILDDAAKLNLPDNRPVRQKRHISIRLTNGAWLSDDLEMNTELTDNDFIERVELVNNKDEKEIIIKIYLPENGLNYNAPEISGGNLHLEIFKSNQQ